ncbi:MAG TPA: ATP-grasp domain-containing protein [Burkholderiaceae bacterium]|nr:ATP-grasp domain-containing protein [Burkholderiaceae bacterium]
MRIHLYEHVTGGGMAGEALPAGLCREALLMRDALVSDLLAIEDLELSVAVDERCPPPAANAADAADAADASSRLHVRMVAGVGAVPGGEALARDVAWAQAAWIVAPETAAALERASAAVLAAGRRLIGSQPTAVRVAASKAATFRCLAAAGVATVPTYAVGPTADMLPDPLNDALRSAAARRWVVKPDDGAGCEDTWVVDGRAALLERLPRVGPGHVVQPWIDGDARSLSVAIIGGRVELLSVNRQHVRVRGGAVALDAIDVNAVPRDPRYLDLAERVATAIPGLAGYFGIDVVESATGPVVIEVNPRLTTSYAGLRAARSMNVAARLLQPGAGAPRDAVERTVRLQLGSAAIAEAG